MRMELTPGLSTVLGASLALVGGFAGQWWSERRAAARESRERDHEREIWARHLRFEAHVAFLAEYDRKYTAYAEATLTALDGEEPEDDYLVSLYDRYQAVRLVCTDTTARSGREAQDALSAYVFADGTPDIVDHARDNYVDAARHEFGLHTVTTK